MVRGQKQEILTPEERLQTAFVPEIEQPYRVPRNWCWVYWGVCGDFQAGSAFKNEYQGLTEYKIPFYKVGSLKYSDSSGILYDTSNTVNEEIRNILKAALIPENSIIFAKIGEAIRLNRRSINPVACCIDNNLMSFCPKVCTTKYVYFWSLGIDLYNYTNATTVPAIRKSDLEKVAFPLAPSAEQQRIVDRIESLFAKLDEAKQKAQNALDSFETRKAAILHKAFTGELTAQWRKEHGVGMESWEARTSTQLFEYVTSGSRGWAKYYADNGDIFVRMGNLNHGTIELDLSDIQYVNLPGQTEGQRTKLQKNDILISITADIGMVGIVREMEQNAYINQHIALARPTAKDNAEFLAWYLISDVGLQQMRNKQRGATKIGLGLDDIRSLELLIPTREEQDEVVYILDNLLANEQQAKEVAEGVLEQIDLIKKAILARAFRGELGTNDPSEENAVELLFSKI